MHTIDRMQKKTKNETQNRTKLQRLQRKISGEQNAECSKFRNEKKKTHENSALK